MFVILVEAEKAEGEEVERVGEYHQFMFTD
jgi:hypothetical protein